MARNELPRGLEHRRGVRRKESRRIRWRRAAGWVGLVSQDLQRSRNRERQASVHRLRWRLSQQRSVDQRSLSRQAALWIHFFSIRLDTLSQIWRREECGCSQSRQLATTQLPILFRLRQLSQCMAFYGGQSTCRSLGHLHNNARGDGAVGHGPDQNKSAKRL